MDFRLVQDAERQMLRDGKSAASIDEMKTAYRQQVFNTGGYSQTAGLGSFASGGEAYGPPPVSGPVPQGINKNIGFAEGGAAMRGIGTLNDTARNMTRGPRGIGAYQQYADGGPVSGIPRYAELMNEPHMLAYINPQEEQMLRDAGGAGIPGPDGVPVYGFWSDNFGGGNSFRESVANTFTPGDGASYVGGQLVDDNTGSSISAGGYTSTGNPISGSANNSANDNAAKAAQVQAQIQDAQVQAAIQAASQAQAAEQARIQEQAQAAEQARIQEQAVETASQSQTAQNSLKGSGIVNNSLRPRLRPIDRTGIAGLYDDAKGAFKSFLPTRILGGIANDVTMGFRAGFGNSESQRAKLMAATDSEGNPLYSPFEVDEYLAVTEETRARQQQETMNNNDSNSGNAIYDGGIQPLAFAQGESGAVDGTPIKYASDFLDPNRIIVPDPVYLPVGLAEGGPVYMNEGGMAQGLESSIGMGFPGGPPMAGVQQSYREGSFNDQVGDLMRRQDLGHQPLQQYGQYLGQKYGGPPTDFAQKRDQFLQEVSQKEQQTFQEDGPMGLNSSYSPETNYPSYLQDLMGGGPQPLSSGAPLSGFQMEAALNSTAPMMQLFADGGPVYMNEGGVSDKVAARRASTEDLDNLAVMVQKNYGFNPVDVALKQGIDPELALRVMYEESKGEQSAGSGAGARGLMQLMPDTAKELGVDINDALQNYTGGLRYLKKMTDQFGLEVGLAAYNAGPGNVAKYDGVPPFEETQNYLRIIAEPFTGASVEGLINTGAENYLMDQPVMSQADVELGRNIRPQLRPEVFSMDFAPQGMAIRPQLRPEMMGPEQEAQGIEAFLPREKMAEKYSMENMAQLLGLNTVAPPEQGGIASMSASR